MADDDVVVKLRRRMTADVTAETMDAAADEIEHLRAEVERLRKEARTWQVQAEMNDHPEYWEQLRQSNERMDAAITAGVLEVSDAKSIFERHRLRTALDAWIKAGAPTHSCGYNATSDDCVYCHSSGHGDDPTWHDADCPWRIARAAAAAALEKETDTKGDNG